MRLDIFFALLLFCIVSSVTPGPNNMMLMASGVNFGLRRSLPHLAGVVLGYTLMVALVGFGLDAIFRAAPGAAVQLDHGRAARRLDRAGVPGVKRRASHSARNRVLRCTKPAGPLRPACRVPVTSESLDRRPAAPPLERIVESLS